METYEIAKLELTIKKETIKDKTPEQLEQYLQQEVVPVLLSQLTSTSRGNGSVSVSGTATSGGGGSVTVSGTYSW